MTDRVPWVCPVCGTANAPHVDHCCTAPPTASANAAPQAAPQQQQQASNAGKKASRASKAQPLNYEEPQFKAFWDAYPLKRGKATAANRFAAAVAAGAAPQDLIAAALRYRNDITRDPNYTKWPEGWLSARRWEDEPTLAVVPPQPPIQATDWDAMRAEEDARIAAQIRQDTA